LSNVLLQARHSPGLYVAKVVPVELTQVYPDLHTGHFQMFGITLLKYTNGIVNVGVVITNGIALGPESIHLSSKSW